MIVSNSKDSFLVSETTAVMECDMDGNYLYTYVPVSPRKGLILAKSKYFQDDETIKQTKIRFGYKYGLGIPDEYLSLIIDDHKLINNVEQSGTSLTFKVIELSDEETKSLNSIIYQGGKKILYCNKETLEQAKTPLLGRNVCVR